MKKTINTISALILALILTFSFISYQNIQVKAESNNPYNTVTFNLSNPNAQSFKVIENGEEVTYSMSAEILPQTREHLQLDHLTEIFIVLIATLLCKRDLQEVLTPMLQESLVSLMEDLIVDMDNL